jgi:hypothetical protein
MLIENRSPEFWGAVQYPASRWVKTRLFGLVTVGGIVAATAGPSSAILMIPRNRTWPTGGIDFYLNGTVDQLWPSVLTVDNLGGSACNTPNAILYPHCAAGGYQAFINHYTNFGAASELQYFTFDLADNVSTRTIEGNIRNNWQFRSETWTQAPHVATATIQEPIREAWSYYLRWITSKGNPSRFWFSNRRTARVKTQIPVVRTVCYESQIPSAINGTLSFPVLPEYDFWYQGGQPGFDTSYGNGKVLAFTLGSNSEFGSFNPDTVDVTGSPTWLRSAWVELPPEFGSATAGLALQFVGSNETVSRRAMGCTVDARWAQGDNWATSSQPAWQWERAATLVPTRASPSQTRYFDVPQGLFLPTNDSTWRRISATPEYLQGLAPILNSSTNMTTLESILVNSIPNLSINSMPNPFKAAINISDPISLIPFIEHVISTIVADGLARTGSYLQRPASESLDGLLFDGATVVSGWSLEPQNSSLVKSTASMRMETSVDGYAYIISGFTAYIAVASLLLHTMIALLHIFWILWKRQTSSAWDRISELVALAQNSRPAEDVLWNTAGGITKMRTFAITGKVIITDEEKVSLSWSDTVMSAGPIGSDKIKANHPY